MGSDNVVGPRDSGQDLVPRNYVEIRPEVKAAKHRRDLFSSILYYV